MLIHLMTMMHVYGIRGARTIRKIWMVHIEDKVECVLCCYKERRMRKDPWKCTVMSCATIKKHTVQEKAGWRLKQERILVTDTSVEDESCLRWVRCGIRALVVQIYSITYSDSGSSVSALGQSMWQEWEDENHSISIFSE